MPRLPSGPPAVIENVPASERVARASSAKRGEDFGRALRAQFSSELGAERLGIARVGAQFRTHHAAAILAGDESAQAHAPALELRERAKRQLAIAGERAG